MVKNDQNDTPSVSQLADDLKRAQRRADIYATAAERIHHEMNLDKPEDRQWARYTAYTAKHVRRTSHAEQLAAQLSEMTGPKR